MLLDSSETLTGNAVSNVSKLYLSFSNFIFCVAEQSGNRVLFTDSAERLTMPLCSASITIPFTKAVNCSLSGILSPLRYREIVAAESPALFAKTFAVQSRRAIYSFNVSLKSLVTYAFCNSSYSSTFCKQPNKEQEVSVLTMTSSETLCFQLYCHL